MPFPAVSLRLRKIRRRFGISAPRVVVRRHMSWQLMLVVLMLFLLCVGAALWVVTQRNQVGFLARELEGLRSLVSLQAEELAALRSTAGTEKNAVRIEKVAQQALIARIQGLEDENAALKEETRLFERLASASAEEAVVRIESFRVSADGVGRFRYRLILAFKPGRQVPDFRGRFQLAVIYEQGGRAHTLLLPEQKAAAPYAIELKAFLRREGVVELPAGAVIKAVKVRILQGDTLKAEQVAQF